MVNYGELIKNQLCVNQFLKSHLVLAVPRLSKLQRRALLAFLINSELIYSLLTMYELLRIN